jgi:hypothetical protein
MMSSGSSTERGSSGRDTGFRPWHFYMLLSLAGATWAVIVSRDAHPAALLLISGAVLAAGLVGLAMHHSLIGFLSGGATEITSPSRRTREFLEREKALVLRSIKELEFDKAMGKVSDRDFAEIGGRLRAKAMELIQAIEHADARASDHVPVARTGREERRARGATERCPSCGTTNDPDARFCKSCGEKL